MSGVSVARGQPHVASGRDSRPIASKDLRIVVSLNDRQLWAIIGADTLLKAPIAVSTDETLEYARQDMALRDATRRSHGDREERESGLDSTRVALRRSGAGARRSSSR